MGTVRIEAATAIAAAEQADYRTWTADATAKLECDLVVP
jgi:hypothetical protein